eukprot:Selendium_serpulae@DN6068_c1_g1_i1.p1
MKQTMTFLIAQWALTAPLGVFACTQPCADCHVYGEGDYGSCGHQVTSDDINTPCGTIDDPCVTAKYDVTTGHADCGKCFRMTMIEAGDESETVCTGGCPAYNRDVIIRAIDYTGAATFEVAQNAWNVVCPYVCLGGSYCVDDPSICMHGIIEFNWQSGYKPIEYEEVECGQGGVGGTGAPPVDATGAPPVDATTPPVDGGNGTDSGSAFSRGTGVMPLFAGLVSGVVAVLAW